MFVKLLRAPAFIIVVSLICQGGQAAGKVFTPFQFNGKGDARSNDTLALQQALDAAADAGAGTLWIPPNGTFLFDSGLRAIGSRYNGVTIQVDGKMQVMSPPTPFRVYSIASWLSAGCVVNVYNVDGFTMTSKTNGTIQGFLFDEHVKNIIYPGGPRFTNSTNIVVENLSLLHMGGSAWFRNVCFHDPRPNPTAGFPPPRLNAIRSCTSANTSTHNIMCASRCISYAFITFR